VDAAAIRYEVTVNDPGAYTKAWTTTFNLRRESGTELFEYVCQQANYAGELMVGDQKKVDRTAPIIP
jgi:nitrate reductase assembly molybdenum cofactor insertion protein NarJ